MISADCRRHAPPAGESYCSRVYDWAMARPRQLRSRWPLPSADSPRSIKSADGRQARRNTPMRLMAFSFMLPFEVNRIDAFFAIDTLPVIHAASLPMLAARCRVHPGRLKNFRGYDDSQPTDEAEFHDYSTSLLAIYV